MLLTFLEKYAWLIKKFKQFNHSDVASNIEPLLLTFSVNESLKRFRSILGISFRFPGGGRVYTLISKNIPEKQPILRRK